MSQPTAARPRSSEGAHFYNRDGTPLYEVPYADASKGVRPATLADARKLAAIPSVTTYLQVLDKPALNTWKVEQGIHAVMTSPRGVEEELDAFIHRVIQIERVHEQESETARDKGTEIHAAMEALLLGKPTEWAEWVRPAYENMWNTVGFTRDLHLETILVSERHAGKADFIAATPEANWIIDWKSTGTLPKKESYPEHRLQLAAYAKSWSELGHPLIRTANCYISTGEPGKFAFIENPPWQEDWPAFEAVMNVWGWLKSYNPLKCAEKGQNTMKRSEAQTRSETDKELDQLEKTVCL
jgi:hypothetical protein